MSDELLPMADDEDDENDGLDPADADEGEATVTLDDGDETTDDYGAGNPPDGRA